jgi:hypothetical protein
VDSIKNKKILIEFPNIWYWIWITSETLHIPLGKLAPIIFGKMIGVKGKKL